MKQESSGAYSPLYALVRQIPLGKVATYGQLGSLTGMTARQVGYAMAAVPAGEDIPWHRVINSQGKLSLRADGAPSTRQFTRLVQEGLPLKQASARIDLSRYQWQPDGVVDFEEGADTLPDLPGPDLPGFG